MTTGIQGMFEHIISHLFAQGKRAFDVDQDMCVYRHPEGQMCAVGCLLNDEQYSTGLEGTSVVSFPYDITAEIFSRFGIDVTDHEEALDLLRITQCIHDADTVLWADSDTFASSIRAVISGSSFHGKLDLMFLRGLKFPNE